jgi:hypothetical protein
MKLDIMERSQVVWIKSHSKLALFWIITWQDFDGSFNYEMCFN